MGTFKENGLVKTSEDSRTSYEASENARGKLWYLARGDLSRTGSTETVHPRADVRELRRIGWDATLFSSCYGEQKKLESEFVLTRKRSVLERFVFELKFCWMLITAKQRPAVVFIRCPCNLILAALCARLLGIKLVLELNGLFGYVWNSVTPWNAHIALIDKSMMWLANMVVSVTPELRKYAKERCRRSTSHVVAPNGVDLDFGESNNAQHAADDAEFRMGFIGRLYECRALEILLRVVAKLNKSGVQTSLTFAGSGPLKNDLLDVVDELGIAKQVEFLGEIPHAELPQAFKRTNLMWAVFEDYPRFDISGMTPLKVWTYLAMGKPVIARSGSYLQRYEQIPGMYWTSSVDIEEISQVISKFMALDAKDVSDSVSRGKAYVHENATWQNHAMLIDEGLRKMTCPTGV